MRECKDTQESPEFDYVCVCVCVYVCVCVCVAITGYVDLRVPILLPGVMCNGQKSYTVYLDHIFLHTGTVHSIGCPLSTGVHLLCILSSLYFPTMSGMV